MAAGMAAGSGSGLETGDVLAPATADASVRPARPADAAAIGAVQARAWRAAYADVQNAFGRILNSVGAHRLPESMEDTDVATLAETLGPMLDDWRPVTYTSAWRSLDWITAPASPATDPA